MCKCICKLIKRFKDHLYDLFCDNCCNGSGSGSGSGYYLGTDAINDVVNDTIKDSTHISGFKMMRSHKDAIGIGFHRWGWHQVLKHLEEAQSDTGILFDDFIEQNFAYNENPTIIKSPWIGIFHHPPQPPYFSPEREKLFNIIYSKEFQKSSVYLKLAIALSEPLAEYLKEHLTCPVIFLHHPIGFDVPKWSTKQFLMNSDKKIIQVGNYLRNTSILTQIKTPFRKIKLQSNLTWVKDYAKKVENYWDKEQYREKYNDYIETHTYVSPSTYDRMLSKNIVICEYFSLSASNTILDCIARNTPIILNRLPAAENYLGKDYPLFFDKVEEISNFKMADIIMAHNYLKDLDKSKLDINYFIDTLKTEIENL